MKLKIIFYFFLYFEIKKKGGRMGVSLLIFHFPTRQKNPKSEIRNFFIFL